MTRNSPAGIVGRLVGGFASVIGLLVLELVASMLLYTYLNLRHVETFGWLVRLSKGVLDLLARQLEIWFSGSSNVAYATLFGELGPKSILLLLIGLVVAALFRGLIWGLRTALGGER
jgi:hypothetical protein